MIVLAGADLVLPDRVLERGTLVLDGARITEIDSGTRPVSVASPERDYRDLCDALVLPGFVDTHVHGALGVDTLDGDDAVERIARALPRFGVTAFCPTSVACDPPALRRLLAAVGRARTAPPTGAARVLPAHLESNFIHPAWAGAQPVACLRLPPGAPAADAAAFGADDILAEIARAAADVGIVTLAPELPGALGLVARLVAAGHRVSLGHSGATFDEASAAVRAGASRATHLFNRMSPLGHREPGLVGAALHHDDLAVEIICDGVHVHPAAVALAVAIKGPARAMAVTDGTAGAGLPIGSEVALGGRAITVRDNAYMFHDGDDPFRSEAGLVLREAAAYLSDGTLAGSVLTMDRAFAFLTGPVGLGLVEAAQLCSTTPARDLGLQGHGVIAPGAVADLVVLDRRLRVVETYVGGQRVFSRETA